MSKDFKGLIIGTVSSLLATIIITIIALIRPSFAAFIKAHDFVIIIFLFLFLCILIFPLFFYVRLRHSVNTLCDNFSGDFETKLRLLKERLKIYNLLRLSLGIIDCYETRDEAVEKNSQSLIDSQEIYTLNFKCKVLINNQDTEQTLAYKLASNSLKRIKCLILSPKGDADDYILNRIKEIEGQTDSRLEHHKEKIKTAVEDLCYIKDSFKHQNIECRYFCEELKWSLVITDDFLLVTFYGKEKSDNATCFKIKKTSQWGEALVNHFEGLWKLNENNDAFASIKKGRQQNNDVV